MTIASLEFSWRFFPGVEALQMRAALTYLRADDADMSRCAPPSGPIGKRCAALQPRSI